MARIGWRAYRRVGIRNIQKTVKATGNRDKKQTGTADELGSLKLGPLITQ